LPARCHILEGFQFEEFIKCLEKCEYATGGSFTRKAAIEAPGDHLEQIEIGFYKGEIVVQGDVLNNRSY
jgi:translation initiation factor 1 (eIF-1/SUI1)